MDPVGRGPPVLVQNLSNGILWTRRPDRYTLQVLTALRPVATGTAPAVTAGPKTRYQIPDITAWLLHKDGTAIAPMQRWQTPAPKPNQLGRLGAGEVLYAYPVAEGASAVAVVVRTDGEYIVRKIAPFAE